MIYIYDVFTDLYKNDDLRLSPNELYLYCLLYVRRSYDQFVETTIDSIHSSANVKFYDSVDSKNRAIIKDCLLSLRQKNIISFECEEQLLVSRKGNTVVLRISFNQFTENAGYLRVPYSDFDDVLDINYFYIRVAVERFNHCGNNKCGRWISDQEFGYLLGVSKRTFRNYADDMISKGMLYKLSGERYENMQQDKNIYRTIPFEGVEARKKVDYKDQHSGATVFRTVLNSEITVKEIKEYLNHSNWNKKDEFGVYVQIEQDDYDAYRTCEDLGIHKRKVESIGKLIERIAGYGSYDGKFEGYEEEYRRQKIELGIEY